MLEQPNSSGLSVIDIQLNDAEICDDRGHAIAAPRLTSAPVIAELQLQWRRRQNWHRAEKSLTLQIKAICRGLCDGSTTEADRLYKAMSVLDKNDNHLMHVDLAYAASFPLLEARAALEPHRAIVEKRMTKLIKELPVYNWAVSVKGFGPISLAGIIGEAGDLSNYSNPAKLWKRMGVGLVGSERQRKCKDAVKAIEHGYSPSRRSLVWTMGDSMKKTGDEYRKVYLDRKVMEFQKAFDDGLIPCTTSKPTQKAWQDMFGLELEVVKKLDMKLHRSAGHMEKRAQRYMEKRLLRNLWRAWRDSMVPDTQVICVPPEIPVT